MGMVIQRVVPDTQAAVNEWESALSTWLSNRGAGLRRETSEHGQGLIDRELYLPQAWVVDRPRCCQAGIPDERPFLTKPQ